MKDAGSGLVPDVGPPRPRPPRKRLRGLALLWTLLRWNLAPPPSEEDVRVVFVSDLRDDDRRVGGP